MVQVYDAPAKIASAPRVGAPESSELPLVRAPYGPRQDRVFLTAAGRRSLQKELRQLREEQLPALAALLAEARGDRAERIANAELLGIQLEQRRLERRAEELEWLLTVAHEATPSANGIVALGSTVEVEDDDERYQVQVVDPHEADAAEGRVSVASPVGQALLGHARGDRVAVEAPAGKRYIQIVAVS